MKNAQDSWECSWVVKIPASPGGGGWVLSPVLKARQTNKQMRVSISVRGRPVTTGRYHSHTRGRPESDKVRNVGKAVPGQELVCAAGRRALYSAVTWCSLALQKAAGTPWHNNPVPGYIWPREMKTCT